MKKTIIEGLLAILIFSTTWFLFSQIDWVHTFKIKQNKEKLEDKIGNLLFEIFKNTEIEIETNQTKNAIDSIVTHICKFNNIDFKKIRIHIFKNTENNAFALPNGQIIIYSGLIANTINQDELTGVICHEIAHIELNHVMKKVIKEIGLSALISMTASSGNLEILRDAAKIISSTAFDRNLEKQADLKAVDYLINAKVDPEPFSQFLYRMSIEEHPSSNYLTWISTHPDSKERAENILDYTRNKTTDFKPILADETWSALKEVFYH